MLFSKKNRKAKATTHYSGSLMRTVIFIFLLVATAFPSSALAVSYETERLSGNYANRHHHSRINDNNEIVWGAHTGQSYEIFFADDQTVHQLTDDKYTDYDPRINNAGHVVWVKQTQGIFLFDGSRVVRLSSGPRDNSPRINELGEVCWVGYDGNDFEIYYYDGFSVSSLTDNLTDDKGAMINDNGSIVWSSNDDDIFLYDGTITARITDNTTKDSNPVINNSGEIAFIGDGINGRDVFLYSNNELLQLTDNSLNERSLQINDNGSVVWAGYDGHDYEIFRYDGSTVQLSDNEYNDYAPKINNNDLVVWDGYTSGRSQIFLADGTEISSLSLASGWWDYDAQINDNNIVTYWGYSRFGYEIYLSGPKELEVSIDIKPEDKNNRTNNKGHELIPVAVFGSSSFDVYNIDPATVTLEGLSVKRSGKNGKFLAHYGYVNDDQYIDLVLKFSNQEDAFAKNAEQAVLKGSLFDSTAITGVDSISITPSHVK